MPSTGTPAHRPRTTRRVRRTARTRAAASRLMARLLANNSLADLEALLLPISRRHEADDADEDQRLQVPAAMIHSATAENQTPAATRPPRKKPTPFIAFLLPVKKATHLNSWPEASPAVSLDGGFAGGLGQVLGHAADALGQSPPRPPTRPPSTPADSADSSRKPMICVARPTASMRCDAVARGQPAADQVGHHAHRLVQQEQEGQREGRVAQAVEVQQHQHAQRAVAEREAPVRTP